jgi:hypothetical protein
LIEESIFINTLGANGKKEIQIFSLIDINTGDTCDECSTVIPAI